MTRLNINVGKAKLSQKPKFPWEPGYYASVRQQTKALTDVLQSICDQFIEVSPELMVDALQPTFELSQYYCPEDTGRLKASGYLEVTGFRGQPRVELGYGRGGNPYYAVIVHENLEMKHKAPTQAKFLERAIDEDLPNIAIRIGTNYAKFMNG